MKLKVFITLVAFTITLNVLGQDETGAVSAITNVLNAQYPKILPDLRVIFKIKAPEAKSVQVQIGKKYDLKKDDSGMWSGITDPQVPGFHYYSLIIDGVAVADPSSESFFGTSKMSSGIDIPEAGVDFYTIKNVPHGELRQRYYYSDKTKSWRRLFIYTPPDYDKNTNEKYPVLYIQHGAGEDERGWATQGKLDVILDNLIAEGKAKPFIAVMTNLYIINNIGSGYNTESTNNFMDQFGNDLKANVIPFVEKNYRTKTDRENRAIAGLSMGGGTTFREGLLNTDLFAYVGVFSTSGFRGQGGEIFDAEKQIPGILTNPEKFNKSLKLFFVSIGEQDPSFDYSVRTIKKFRESGLKVEFTTFPGAHEWQVWRKSLHDFAGRVFK